MSKDRINNKIEEIARPILAKAGIYLLEAEYIAQKEPIVRLIIFKRTGVSIGDCETATALIGRHLDPLMPGRYHLEVSSPGLERVLKNKEEFDLFSGRKVRLFLREPLDQENFLDGILKGSEDDNVKLETPQGELKIPFRSVERARLLFV